MEQHKEHQRRHFDSAAGDLPERLPLRDTVIALHQVNYNNHVRRLPLRDHGRILEVGFGWVQLIQVLAGDANFHGVGVDLSFGMVAYAHRQRGRMRFLVGDAEALPFASGSFDGVFAISILEHTPNRKKALEDIRRVLRPDGHLLIQLPVQDDHLSWQYFYRLAFPDRYRKVLERLAHDPALVPHVGDLKNELSSLGFSVIWERRDEVFFQPLYDYYVLPILDALKRWKDGLHRQGASEKTGVLQMDNNGPRGPWRPRPSGIHRYLLPLASTLLIPDYLLGKCGIGACLWLLARKRS